MVSKGQLVGIVYFIFKILIGCISFIMRFQRNTECGVSRSVKHNLRFNQITRMQNRFNSTLDHVLLIPLIPFDHTQLHHRYYTEHD